ncbi:hypothetical protein LX32DRAFT_3123 [Colletotrichum zoysiae]|uniref:Uncharacterized protein n=1 Tax=Colletotrichum zoysiae TaxID=1216348 RepID=A0AAD9HW81_9PEZI|nr:hypothetical protein LX32DRAFT_3123 [Colletotrichum zoysiae]
MYVGGLCVCIRTHSEYTRAMYEYSVLYGACLLVVCAPPLPPGVVRTGPILRHDIGQYEDSPPPLVGWQLAVGSKGWTKGGS